MLTLFLARKKMAIWENGAFSAVGEGEIQFQNMVRSMIFSSCQFFDHESSRDHKNWYSDTYGPKVYYVDLLHIFIM